MIQEKIEAAPRMVGRYAIESVLGQGAMAQVYLAHDSQIDRRVAVKVLKTSLRDDADVVHRFLAEARAAGMLSHPNIVTIHDVGEADGVPYIAMEYLEGEPLDVVLERHGRLTCDKVLMLGAQLASALALAHRRGVIHRDVKPSNIIICDNGKVAKLVDFGIARVTDLDEVATERAVNRTQFGQVMGTPRYMSPEQAMGMPVDTRSDLFSLGSIFYEMVTGAPAFAGTGIATLAIQICQQPHAAVTAQVRDCPKGLAFTIDKLLAKKPGERFSDAETLEAALEREIDALRTDRGAHRRGLPVKIKLAVGLAAVSALALTISVGIVLDRQETTLQAMAISSGSSTTDFVSRNVSLRVAENAGLPEAEQDWLPLQSFVEAAGKDRNVRMLRVIDEHGLVRASDDERNVGKVVTGVDARASQSVNQPVAGGFRFLRPIRYAGADFGHVEMILGRHALDSALANARSLLLTMAAFVVAMIFAAGFFVASQLTQPLRRLKTAMDDIAAGKPSFRISHTRRDEFGSVFDAFNGLAAAIEERGGDTTPPDPQAMLMTRLEPAAPTPRKAA